MYPQVTFTTKNVQNLLPSAREKNRIYAIGRHNLIRQRRSGLEAATSKFLVGKPKLMIFGYGTWLKKYFILSSIIVE